MVGDGLIFLLAGPSGTGKNTIVKRVRSILSDLEPVITHTTRKPRPNEVQGVDHFFVTEEKFEALKSAGKFAECRTIFCHQYGSLKSRLERAIEQGVDLISDYDVCGAEELAERYPENVVTIFVRVPPEVARQRLIDRDSEDNRQIAERLDRQAMEMSRAPFFKYQVDNIDLGKAVDDVVRIVRAERCLASRSGLG